MGRDKATKVVRKKGRSPLIFQFQMRCTHFSPTMQMPGISFFSRGEGGGGVSYGISVEILLVCKKGVSIDRGTGC